MSSMKLLNQSEKETNTQTHTANLNYTPIQSKFCVYVVQAFTLAKCYKYTLFFFVNNYMTIAQYSITVWLLWSFFFYPFLSFVAFDLESILN